MGASEVQRGAVAERVRNNIKQIRHDRGYTGAQLAAYLGALGRPMQGTAVNKIETGARRVDVDDLVAIALALNTTPNRLLLNEPASDQDEIEMTPQVTAAGFQAWAWANGEQTLLSACQALGRGDATFREVQSEYLRYAQPAARHPALESIDDLRSAIRAFMEWIDEHAQTRQQRNTLDEASPDVPLDRLVVSAENVRQHLEQAEKGVAQLLDDSPLADQSGYGIAFFASHEVHAQTCQRVRATRAQVQRAEADYINAVTAAASITEALAEVEEHSPGMTGQTNADNHRLELLEAAKVRGFDVDHAAGAQAHAHEAFKRAERELYELRHMMLVRNMVPPQLPADLLHIDTFGGSDTFAKQLKELWTNVSSSRMLDWIAKRTSTQAFNPE